MSWLFLFTNAIEVRDSFKFRGKIIDADGNEHLGIYRGGPTVAVLHSHPGGIFGSQEAFSEADWRTAEAGIGYYVSPDIRLSVEGGSTRVMGTNRTDVNERITEDFSFSYLQPKLYLTVAPKIDLIFGGIFRAKRANLTGGEDLTKARLYQYDGAYGNTIFGSMNISL